MNNLFSPVLTPACDPPDSLLWQEFSACPDWRKISAYNSHVMHQVYQCELYCWLAVGPVKVDSRTIETQFFLYCEYRDCSGASQYVVYSFSSLAETLDFRDRFVIHQVLPNISPEQTRKRPLSA